MQSRKFFSSFLGLVLFFSSGCGATVTTYVKPEAPWAAIKRIAILPFNLPTENPVQRELSTQVFSQELRNVTSAEVVEVPLNDPTLQSGLWNVKQVAKQFQADAVLSGSVDETHGTVIHVRVQDAATEDLLWSGTYVLGTRAEFFSVRTQQQQFQRGFRSLADQFAAESS